MQSFVFWRWPHSSTFLTLTENAFVKFLGSGDWCKVEFLLITVMSPKLPQSSRPAQLRDVRKSLAAKNEEGIRPNKQRQPANLPLIQQLQARKAFSLSANLVTKKKGKKITKDSFWSVMPTKKGKLTECCQLFTNHILWEEKKVSDTLQDISTWFRALKLYVHTVTSSKEEWASLRDREKSGCPGTIQGPEHGIWYWINRNK